MSACMPPLHKHKHSDTHPHTVLQTSFLIISQYLLVTQPLFPENAMAPHSSTLAWKVPWVEKPGRVEEPGRLQSMGSLRVRHDWATSLFSLFTFMHCRRKRQPTPVSCLENPRDQGAWWAAIYGVAQSRIRLKQLSSSSSSNLYFLIKNFSLLQERKLQRSWTISVIQFHNT